MDEILKKLTNLVGLCQAKLQELADREANVLATEKSAQEITSTLKQSREELRAREEAVASREKAQERLGALTDRETALRNGIHDLNEKAEQFKKTSEARAKELQDQEDKVNLLKQSLETRELSLSREKESYKQTLKDEFYRNVASR